MNGHGKPIQDQPRSPLGDREVSARERKTPKMEKLDGMNFGMRVLSYLIAGVALYGFLGWVGDRVLGTALLLPVGIVLGAALGCFIIIRRFGRVEDIPAGSPGEAMITTPTGETDKRAR